MNPNASGKPPKSGRISTLRANPWHNYVTYIFIRDSNGTANGTGIVEVGTEIQVQFCQRGEFILWPPPLLQRRYIYY